MKKSAEGKSTYTGNLTVTCKVKSNMRKGLFFIFTVSFIAFGCTRSNGKTYLVHSPIRYLSRQEAEKIMGEPLRMNDSSSGYANGAYYYQCSYFSVSADNVTGRIGKLYYMYEEYDKESEAHGVYEGFKIANGKNSPLNDLSFGDEGYYQGPPGPPPFILVRKGKKMLRLKVNKSTSHTPSDGLMAVARAMTSSL